MVLEKTFVIEVRLSVDIPQSWIKELQTGHKASVRIMDVKSAKEDPSVHDFIEVSSPELRAEEMIRAVLITNEVSEADLTAVDEHRVVGSIKSEDCPVCSTFAGLNCYLVSATANEEKMVWNLFMNADRTLRTLLDRLDKKGVRYKLDEVTKLSRRKELTARQEQILRTALYLGYFEFPRRIKIDKLADSLGVSPGTLSEILRRAEKHIMMKYFDQPPQS